MQSVRTSARELLVSLVAPSPDTAGPSTPWRNHVLRHLLAEIKTYLSLRPRRPGAHAHAHPLPHPLPLAFHHCRAVNAIRMLTLIVQQYDCLLPPLQRSSIQRHGPLQNYIVTVVPATAPRTPATIQVTELDCLQ
jgi:hypothetical protein